MMRLSTKVRYGVRAMIELAKHENGQVVPLGELAARQRISHKYLEPIVAALKIAGLVGSVMGKGGGYRLLRPASDITLWDICSILDVSSVLIDCKLQTPGARGACPRLATCVARETWMELDDTIISLLKSKNLKDLARREMKLQSEAAGNGRKARPRRSRAKA